MKKAVKRIFVVVACLLALIFLAAGSYVIYMFADYSRLEDSLPLEIVGNRTDLLPAGEKQTLVTWNLGFGAYSRDYSFFMDGGKESRACSSEDVYENIGGALERLSQLNPDLMLLQEIDVDATRSHHIDQSALVNSAFPDMNSIFAQNYDSGYLFYPLTEPHGASRSGLMTLSDYAVDSSLRRSLPVETDFMKFFDLDRCYSVSRIPTDNGRTLCLYNLHLSAYTSDGTIASQQLKLLLADMAAELAAGNYVIAGGDFNKDLPGNSSEIFGVSCEGLTWAQPIDRTAIPEGFSLVDSVNSEAPVPSCRNADQPYSPGETFVLTVDGFIVSENIEVLSAHVSDEGFAFSDHNPVVMTFLLKP